MAKEERHFICGFAADVTECKSIIWLNSMFRGEIAVWRSGNKWNCKEADWV